MGKAHDSKMIDELRSNFIFNEVVADEKRKTVRFVNPYFDASQSTADNGDEEGNILNIIAAEPSISVEEIATMKLKHIKKIAEAETEAKDLKDCVITVPEFWSYKERQSLLDASQMAGLNVLGLINENTAGLFVDRHCPKHCPLHSLITHYTSFCTSFLSLEIS